MIPTPSQPTNVSAAELIGQARAQVSNLGFRPVHWGSYAIAGGEVEGLFQELGANPNDWGLFTADAAIALDEDIYTSGPRGRAGLKVTLSTSVAATLIARTLATAVDARGCWLRLRWRLNDASSWLNISMMRLGTDTTNRFTRGSFGSISNVGAGQIYDLLEPFPGTTWTPAGTATAADIKFVRVDLNKSSAAATPVPNATLLDMDFFPPIETPGVIIRLDDGYASQQAVAAYCGTLGLPVNLAMPYDVIGSGEITVGGTAYGPFLSEAQLHRLKRGGHKIVNHLRLKTLDDTAILDWVDLTAAQKVAQVQRSIRDLSRAGFADGARIMVTPGGGWNAGDDDLLIGKYLDIAAPTTLPGHGFEPWHPAARYGLVHCAAANIGDWTAAVNRAVQYGGVAVLLEHSINLNVAASRDAIKYIADLQDKGVLRVMTFADLDRRYNAGPRIWYGDESSDTRRVTIRFPHRFARAVVYTSVSGSNGEWGEPEAVTGLSVATGRTVATVTANAVLEVMANASGVAEIDVEQAGAATVYLHVLQDGVFKSAGAMTFAA